MASHYPEPPTTGVPGDNDRRDRDSPVQPPPAYDPDHGLSQAAQEAVAAAHHGLQVLQNAIAQPVGEVQVPVPVQQSPPVDAALYAAPPQSAYGTARPDEAMAPAPMTPLTPTGQTAKEKLTRLRRACDMCSQRKVKVRRRESAPLPPEEAKRGARD